MIATLALFCLAVVGVSLLGGLLPLATVLSHTRLQVYLSGSAGVMLGAAFFHMLPEAVELGSVGVLRWAAGGLLALFLIERFFSFHHHETLPGPDARSVEHAHGPADGHLHRVGAGRDKSSALHWKAAAFGLAFHSLAGGVALASAAQANATLRSGLGATAWGVFFATLLHKPADALTIVTLMLRAGVSKRVAHVVNLGFALMIPAGVALFFLGIDQLGREEGARITGAALAFSAGTFLCIALSDILPELQFHAHDRVKLSAALIAGLAFMALTTAAEPHAHDEDDHHAPASTSPPRIGP